VSEIVIKLFGKTGVFLHPILQAICFKKPVKSLTSCQTIVGQKGVFFHPIVQGICFKKPVKSLNFRRKRFIFPYCCAGIEQTIFNKLIVEAKNLSII
jgi:hypothetical protein